jgi:hypothetical protein
MYMLLQADVPDGEHVEVRIEEKELIALRIPAKRGRRMI